MKRLGNIGLKMPFLFFTAILCVLTVSPGYAADEDYLSFGEVAGIAAGSGAVLGLGLLIRNIDSAKSPLLGGPLLLDKTMHNLLGGKERLPGQQNFLDNRMGSLYTPLISGVILIGLDLKWRHYESDKEAMQDVFLFTSGVFVTKGLTSIAKGLTARPRPYIYYRSDDSQQALNNHSYDHSSFFSGHTSSAFYSSVYLNLRMRSIMRREMAPDEYRRWRWAPPAVLFSWASFVGLSRVQAGKHYFSDVLAGAAVGYLVAELYYSLGNKHLKSSGSGAGMPMLLTFSFRF